MTRKQETLLTLLCLGVAFILVDTYVVNGRLTVSVAQVIALVCRGFLLLFVAIATRIIMVCAPVMQHLVLPLALWVAQWVIAIVIGYFVIRVLIDTFTGLTKGGSKKH